MIERHRVSSYYGHPPKIYPKAIMSRKTLDKKKYVEPVRLTSSLDEKALSLNKITFSYKVINKTYEANNKMFFTILELITILINFQNLIHRNDPDLLEYSNEHLVYGQHEELRCFVKIYIIDNKPDNFMLGSVWYNFYNYQ